MDLAGPAVPAAIHLVLQDVSLAGAGAPLLDDVSLEVRAGAFLALLGPAGGGPAALLRAVAGLGAPVTGRIVLRERDITRLPPGARDIGMVFASGALFPSLDVRANIGYGLRGTAWPRAKAEARVGQMLAMLGLEDHARAFPAHLPAALRQRVALARALAPQPALLLLEEPLAGLDPPDRAHLRTEIRALQKALGVTTLMATQDAEQALAAADRLVVMRAGRILQEGTPEEVYRRPANPFVAGFVGRAASFRAEVEHPPASPARLRAGQVSLAASAAASLSPGEAARAYFRPEDVRLGDEALGHEGAFEAVVTGIEFLGAQARLHLLADGVTLEAELPSAQLARLELGRSARLWVAIPADRIMTYPDG